MDAIISHMAALETMRQPFFLNRLTSGFVCSQELPSTMPSAKELGAALRSSSSPVGVLLDRPQACHDVRGLVPHTWTRPLPAGAIVQISPGLRCVSPGLLLLQLAPKLTELELVLLLSELMGTYALRGNELLKRPRPLVAIDELEWLLAECGSIPGSRAIRNAMKLAPFEAASPMEAMLYARVVRGYSRGGYKMGEVLVNDPVMLETICGDALRRIRKPDLIFVGPKGRALLEYQGLHHVQTVKEDAVRRNEFLANGFTPFEIYKEQYDDLDYMDSLMARIREEVGLPARKVSVERARREREAREELWRGLEVANRRSWERRLDVR